MQKSRARAQNAEACDDAVQMGFSQAICHFLKVPSHHSVVVSINADMAQYNLAVISKTLMLPVFTRSLFLKHRRDSAVTSKTPASQKRTTRLLPLKILTVNQSFFSTNMQANLKCDSTIPSCYSSITSKNNGYIKHKHDRPIDWKRSDRKAKKHTQNGMKSSSL
jgi:hypothetical protein